MVLVRYVTNAIPFLTASQTLELAKRQVDTKLPATRETVFLGGTFRSGRDLYKTRSENVPASR